MSKTVTEVSETIVQLLDDFWNNKNFKVIDDTFSFDCVNRNPIEETQGVNGFKKFALSLFNSFPDLKYVSHEVITDFPTIINRWTFSGTMKSDFAGFKANNKKITWSGITLNKLSEGTISEVQIYFDRKELYDQISQS